MKTSKCITSVLLGLLVLMLLLPIQVQAAGRIDLEQDVNLTISAQEGEIPLVGAKFDIYLVATVDEYGELTTTEEFDQFHVNIQGQNDDAWKKLASTLEGYVLRDQIAPTDTGKTDDQGMLFFPNNQENLKQGLYLVIGDRHTQDGYVYEASPFVVLLPSLDKEANDWVYEVSVNSKHDSEQVPEEPNTTTREVLKVWKDEEHEKERPKEIIVQLLCDGKIFKTETLNADIGWNYTWTGLDSDHKWTIVEKELKNYTVTVTREGVKFVVTNTYNGPENPTSTVPDKPGKTKLPQTGQLWLPVPVLIAAGLLLVVIGLLRRRGVNHEK